MNTLAENKKAKFDYDIKDTFVAGLILSGAEVKSVKNGNVSLSGSYAHIGPYKYAPAEGYDPTHTRSLLLKQNEINALLGKEKGLVIVPLEIFSTPRGWLKVRLGVGRARKKMDKREYIKKRGIDKEIRSQIHK